MNVGKLVRLNRLFSHPSGRLCSIAVDHFIGYTHGLPAGLREIVPTLAAIVDGQPDALSRPSFIKEIRPTRQCETSSHDPNVADDINHQ